MTSAPIMINRDSEHDHIQISTAGIGKASRNDKILITSRNGDIWITAIDYDGKSVAVPIDHDALSELMHQTRMNIM